MQRVNSPFLILAATLIAACGGDPKLDATSSEKLQSSLEEVRQSLPVDRREVFDSAYQKVALGGGDAFSVGMEMLAGASEGEIPESVRNRLDGKTARDIFRMADSIHLEELKEEVASLETRVSNLVEEQKRAAEAQKNLRDFQVLRSRFYKRENALGMEEPILDLTVENATDTAISRVFFTGTIKSPERAVPWLDSKSFNYTVPGGVEPGEQTRWRLKPNMFSEWGNVDAPDDAEFSVEVVELRGPDGETLWSSRDFGDQEQAELDSLRSRLDSLSAVIDSLSAEE